MERKRILAFVLALGMVFGSTMTAFADDDPASFHNEGTVDGTADVKYVETVKYLVQLPTSSMTADVLVDPQGLTKMAGETATLEELKKAGYAGKIYGKNKIMIENKSSFDVKVTAAMKIVIDDAENVKTEVSQVTVSAGDANEKKPYFMLYAVPSQEDVKGNVNNYVAAEKAFKLTTNEGAVDFILPAADYQVRKTTTQDASGNDVYSYSYERKTDSVHGTAFSIEGVANPNGDWAAYADGTKTIQVSAKFTFTGDTRNAKPLTGEPYGMTNVDGMIPVKPAVSGPSAPSAPSALTYNSTSGCSFTVSFGLGESAATKISKIQWSNDGTTFSDFKKPSDNYVIDGKNVTIKASYNSAKESGTVSYLKVVFDKGDAVIKMTKE